MTPHTYHDIEQITVPACLEEFRQDYEGVAWYGKTFDLPAAWHGQTVRLCFEAVNYRAEVWVNGRAAGHHEGGYVGFALEIGDLLHVDQTNASPPRHSRPWGGPPWGVLLRCPAPESQPTMQSAALSVHHRPEPLWFRCCRCRGAPLQSPINLLWASRMYSGE